MKIAIRLIAALATMSAGGRADEPPPTRLYVKTIPAGAHIFLNSQEIGQSDDLFVIRPGMHAIRAVLAGYIAQEQQVDVLPQRITRLELMLVRLPAPATGPASTQDSGDASAATIAYVRAAALPDAIQDAMLTVLRQHPGGDRWSGQSDHTIFGVAAKALPVGPAGQQAVPALLNLTQTLAVHELLKAKSLLERYADTGLTDSTTLCQAVEDAAGKLHVVGTVKTLKHQAAARHGFVVGYVFADEQDLASQLLQDAELDKVRAAYRDIMHSQARDLMAQSNYKDALLLWRHLHSRRLVSQSLYLDAAKCFQALKENDAAVRVLAEAIEAFSESAPPEFFERAGDFALSIDLPSSQELAESAYNLASAKMLNAISPSSQPAQEGLNLEAHK